MAFSHVEDKSSLGPIAGSAAATRISCADGGGCSEMQRLGNTREMLSSYHLT